MKKPLPTILGSVLMVMSPLVVIGVTAYTMTLPRLYEAEAKISMTEERMSGAAAASTEPNPSFNPFYLRTQFEIIKSRPVLDKVIENLNLTKEWGRKFNEDKSPISRGLAHDIITSSLLVQPYRDTRLVSIVVKMEDGSEAALIANEIAKIYRDTRLGELRDKQQLRIGTYRQKMEKQQEQLAEQAVERISRELGVAPSGPRATTGDGQADLKAWREKYLPVERAGEKLLQERAVAGELKVQLAKEEVELEVLRSPVTIIDPAEASNTPVSPNLFLNITISLVVAGILFLSGLGMVLVATLRKKSQGAVPV